MRRAMIGVIGASVADESAWKDAEHVGRLIGQNGFLLVCGGLGGVMEAAAKGAKQSGGTTIGVLPQAERTGANPYIDIPIATGFGEGRNIVIIRTSDVLVAVRGEYGTLSEIAFALRMGKPVIGLHTWDIPGVVKAETPRDAFEKAVGILAVQTPRGAVHDE